MNTITRTRTGLVATRGYDDNRVSEADYAGAMKSWTRMRAEAHRTFWETRRRTLGLPYHVSAEQKARIDRDAIYLAQCDNWDAVHANCEPILIP